MPSNMEIWNQVEATRPSATKSFNRKGFRGTAINPTALNKRATEIFGPVGIGWGWRIDEERFERGALIGQGEVPVFDVIHILRVTLWYKLGDEMGHITQYGQTPFVLKDSRGFVTDEEAPKKSLTDAIGKCLAALGFSADIHLGMWDDNKYVTEQRRNEEGSTVFEDITAAISDATSIAALNTVRARARENYSLLTDAQGKALAMAFEQKTTALTPVKIPPNQETNDNG